MIMMTVTHSPVHVDLEVNCTIFHGDYVQLCVDRSEVLVLTGFLTDFGILI